MNDQDRRQNGAEYDTGCTRRELLRTMAGGALLGVRGRRAGDPARGHARSRREQGLAGDVLAPEQVAELWATLPTLLVENPEEG